MDMCTKCGISPRYYKFYCKACKKQIDADSYRKHRNARLTKRKEDRKILRDWLISMKNKPCHDCEQAFPHYVMEWDHLPGYEKSFDVCMAASKQLALAEMKKCELVCANCHRRRTHVRQSGVDGDTRPS